MADLNLHSFPTRRSSDLEVVAFAVVRTKGHLADLGSQQRVLDNRYVVLARSEEHTSELQSRRDLVCRLLLEKKKLQRIGLSHCRGHPPIFVLLGANLIPE